MHVVVNASPLILLTKVGQLQLLPAIASSIIVPRVVLGELEAGDSTDRAAELVAAAPWASIVESPSSIPEEVLVWDLGAGETDVLAWAASHQESTAVVDDKAARNCAAALGVPVIGTLGIILAAREAKLVPAARPILEQLRQAGHYLSDNILAAALRRIGE